MKTVHVPLEDAEYKRLLKAKGDQNWHDFLMKLCESEVKKQ